MTLFFVCLDKAMKWLCYVSLYHGHRVTLSDVGVEIVMSNRRITA